MTLICEKHPDTRTTVSRMLREKLADFELNPPVLNSFLASNLVDLGDEQAAPIIHDVYAKKFFDEQVMDWQTVWEKFKHLGNIPKKVTPVQYRINDFHYSGDERLQKMLHSLDSHYSVDQLKCLMLGSILSVKMVQPSAVLDLAMVDINGDELDFTSEGQAMLLYREFFGLWNQLSEYQQKLFELPEWPGQNDVLIERRFRLSVSLFRRKMQLACFIEGLNIAEESDGYLAKPWAAGFLETLEKQLDAISALEDNRESFDTERAEKLLAEIEAYWNQNYLQFAQSCHAERLNMIEQTQFVETHKNVGRNERCPCGSGKKFKKCCLGLRSLN